MKKLAIAAMAAVAIAASALAETPVNPAQGAVCNLYKLDTFELDLRSPNDSAYTNFLEVASTLAAQPAAATFVDTATAFQPSEKVEGVISSWGMWTGWLKQDKAGTYTFLCTRVAPSGYTTSRSTFYSISVNGETVLEGVTGQQSFDVELKAGFNSVTIIAECLPDSNYPLTLSYKRKGSVKDPIPFGPETMFYDDVE